MLWAFVDFTHTRRRQQVHRPQLRCRNCKHTHMGGPLHNHLHKVLPTTTAPQSVPAPRLRTSNIHARTPAHLGLPKNQRSGGGNYAASHHAHANTGTYTHMPSCTQAQTRMCTRTSQHQSMGWEARAPCNPRAPRLPAPSAARLPHTVGLRAESPCSTHVQVQHTAQAQRCGTCDDMCGGTCGARNWLIG